MVEIPLLQVLDLEVAFRSERGLVRIVKGVSFELALGETLALVGESGSGKSVTALSILQLLPPNVTIYRRGSIKIAGIELIGSTQKERQAVRGRQAAIIFQEPMTALNPIQTVGHQIGEALRAHRKLTRTMVRQSSLELLELVRFDRGEKRLALYPYQLSGGQRQRVMIAMALASRPQLLIADEPTTALDVTTQMQIFSLLKDLQTRFGMALLLITHDLGLVVRQTDRVAVMSDGIIVETGGTAEVLGRPRHPCTKNLLTAVYKRRPIPTTGKEPLLLEARNINVSFAIRRRFLQDSSNVIKAVNGVDIKLRQGETLGIVGESGSGKTTLGLAILRLVPSLGTACFAGYNLDNLKPRQLQNLRCKFQIVFQDSSGSLSPRMSVEAIIAEGLAVHQKRLTMRERKNKIEAMLAEVGLDPSVINRFPHEFSGGERQRIAIARAIVMMPQLIVLDEPTAALDRVVQMQIIDLLLDLQQRHHLSYIFISHDLSLIRTLCHSVMVIQNGKVCETGSAEQIFATPRHSHTRHLLEAAMFSVFE